MESGVVAAWLALNLWGTWRVRRAGLETHQNALLFIFIWMAPVVGVLGAVMVLPSMRPAPTAIPRDKLPLGFVKADAPTHITMPGAAALAVQEVLVAVDQVPILNAQAFDAWVHSFPDATQRRSAANLGHQAWLLFLRDAMGAQVNLFESEQALILSSLEPHVVKAADRYVTKGRQRISHFLRDLAQFSDLTKSILIIFDSPEQYYQYVGIYYPDEGEFALSSGMFINAGCPHFVALRADLAAIEPTITHELTHSALSYLKLPRWIDEGIAVNVEQAVAGSRTSSLTAQELRAMHLQFWNAQTIQAFWSGESFFRSDDGSLLSYELARMLVKSISSDFEAFSQFVRAASREDGGAGAAQTHLSLDLGQCVASFLESELAPHWAPVLASQRSEDDAH